MLSNYCKETANKSNISIDRVKKLVGSLGNKVNMFFITGTCSYFTVRNDADKNSMSAGIWTISMAKTIDSLLYWSQLIALRKTYLSWWIPDKI